MWVWGKNLWNENLDPQWRFKSTSMVYYFTKMGKMPDLGFWTSYKDVLCPKLEKKSWKAKIGPSKCFIWYFIAIFRELLSIGIFLFLAKISPKSHFIEPYMFIFHCNIYSSMKNMSQKISNQIGSKNYIFPKIYAVGFSIK